MKRPGFFIGRYPDNEANRHIKAAQAELRDVENITIVQQPHLTYAGGKRIAKATANLNAENLNMLIHPLPETANEKMTLDVKGIRSVQGRRLLPYLIIDLEDRDDMFREEQRAIRNKIDTYLWVGQPRAVPPHVSLGKVSIESLNLGLIERIEDGLPTSLTFSPISFPHYTDENVGEVADTARLAPRQPTQIRRASVPEGLVRAFRSAQKADY